MTWWQALPAFISAVALIMLPGLVLSRALGAKGFSNVAMAPVASAALVGVAGIAGGILNLRWNVLFLAAATLIFAGAALLLRFAFRRMIVPVNRSSQVWYIQWITVAVVLGSAALLVAKRLMSAMRTPDSFAQVYDNVFHLNAIRYILDTGNASTLSLGKMVNPTGTSDVYPSVWHSFGALIVQLTNSNILVAENALTIVVCAVLWPFACIALVRGIVGPRVIPTVVAGILAAGFWAFPYHIIQWGPLFPNTLSYSLLPLALLLVAELFGLLRERSMDYFTLATMLAVSIAGLLLTQPNGFSALLAFTVPMALAFWLRQITRLVQSKAGVSSYGVTFAWGIGAALVFVVAWKLLLLPYDNWKPTRGLVQAGRDVITGGLLGGNFTWLASMLACLGLIAIVVKRRGFWIVGCMAVAGGLYVVAAHAPVGPFRHFIVGSWYQDPHRLAALVPLFTLVLACVGVDGLFSLGSLLSVRLGKILSRGTAEKLNKPSPALTSTAAVVALAVATLVFIPLSNQANHKGLDIATSKIAGSWSFKPGWIVSSDEYKLMSRLDSEIPEDAVIAVDPFNGGSLAYAISGRRVTQYHLTPGPLPALSKIASDLSTSRAGSETCKLANSENIHYILDFGSFYMLNVPAAKQYPGFVDIKPSSTIKLIDHQGPAKLYKVIGC